MIKIKVIEHDGSEHDTEVEAYDAAEVHEKRMRAEVEAPHSILIGDISVDARNIKMVKVVR